MDNSQPPSPRQRLQALLAIPERDRTDSEWDELNELEIMLAPGNREGAPMPGQGPRRNGQPPIMSHGGKPNANGGGGGKNKRQGKKFHKRPGRGNAP